MRIELDDMMQKNKSKSKKMTTIILILIIITIIALIAIVFAIKKIQGSKLVVKVDGTVVNIATSTFIFTDNGEVYISIKDIAPFVKYEAHKGEYKVDSEDTNKMYVEAKNQTETASFYLNSNIISKVAPNSKNDYENITIKEPVTMINNKLYVSTEGFQIGFNSSFYYNKETNTITIKTLPKLITEYTSKLKNYGYSKISENFSNQKALVHGKIVAYKENSGKYGVITTKGSEIISPRYNKIQFVESSGEFIITNSTGKVGIAYDTGKTKITVSYDDIKVLDNTLGLYLVKSNEKYGIIDSSENIIAHIEYDQIGIDISQFPVDGIKNQYILCNNIIPAKRNDKWVLLDIKGNRLTQDEYDSLGYINKKLKEKVVNNCLIIGDTETIVVSKDGLYGGVDIKGNNLIPIKFEAIYSIINTGETTYYLLSDGSEYDATQFIDAMKSRLGYEIQSNANEEKENSNTEENNNEINNNPENEIDTNMVNSTNNLEPIMDINNIVNQ